MEPSVLIRVIRGYFSDENSAKLRVGSSDELIIRVRRWRKVC